MRRNEVMKQSKNDGIASHSLAMTIEGYPVRLLQFTEGSAGTGNDVYETLIMFVD